MRPSRFVSSSTTIFPIGFVLAFGVDVGHVSRHLDHPHAALAVPVDHDRILHERLAGHELDPIAGRHREPLEGFLGRQRRRVFRHLLKSGGPGFADLGGVADSHGRHDKQQNRANAWKHQRIILTPEKLMDMRLTRRELGRTGAMTGDSRGGSVRFPANRGSLRRAQPEAELEVCRRSSGSERSVQLRRPRHGRRRAAQPLPEAQRQRASSCGRSRSKVFSDRPAANGKKVTPEEMRKWRASVQVDRAAAFRKKYEGAGVAIEIVKYDGIYTMADEEVDYCFNLAKTLGARAISCEIDLKHTERLGQFADKHKMMVGFHGHAATTPAHWESAFAQAKFNWRESGHRPFRRRQQHVACAVHEAASRAHHAHPREGSQDEGRARRRRSARATPPSSKCSG